MRSVICHRAVSCLTFRSNDNSDVLSINHHQWLSFATPEYARVVEAWNVNVATILAFTVFCRSGRNAEGHRCRGTPHSTGGADMVQIIRRALLFPWSPICFRAGVANIGFTYHVLLMVPISHDSANHQILVRGPIWKRDDGRIPKHSVFGFHRIRGDLRDILNNV